MSNPFNLPRVRAYLSVFTVFLVVYYFFKLDLSTDNLSTFGALSSGFLLLSGIIVEYFVALILISILSRYRYSRVFAYLALIAYVGINYLQIISLEISADFVTKLAIGNAEFAGLLFTTENVLIVVVCLLILVIAPYIITTGLIRGGLISSTSLVPRLRNLSLLIISGILFAVLINNAKYWLPEEVIASQIKLLRKNTIKQLKPVNQLSKLFKEEPASELFPVLSGDDIKALQQFGLPINPAKRFPLLKDSIYESAPPFLRNDLQKPNVILIFTEGFSARTASVYSDKYPKLTPNLEAFSRESMVVSNYYNHTAATYRGLHGGLCSLFPKYGALGGWLDSFENIPKTNYKCLTDILAGNGYKSYYLDPHFTDTSGLDEMMTQLKFDEVLNAEGLLHDYLNDEKSLRPSWISDHQMYRSLVGLLAQRKEESPFFLTMYSVETHAWVDVVEDGVEYRNGKRNVLNTIHNTDHAFGEFWRYFKASEYADNTIIIFTSDHAHYYSRPYTKLMEAYEETSYQKLFIGQIPMIIYDPGAKLPMTFDAEFATSIDLAPSLLHLLGIPNEKNAFVGTSIFEQGNRANIIPGIASYGESTYIVDQNKIHDEHNSDNYRQQLELIGRYIKFTQALEVKNRIYP